MKVRSPVRRMFIFDGFVLFVGRVSDTSAHAHYAAQLSLALGAPLSLESGGQRRDYSAALVPTNVEHQLRCPDDGVALLYVDPSTLAGEAVGASFSADHIHPLSADLAHVTARAREVLAAGCNPEQADALRIELLGAVTPSAPAPSVVDDRVRLVMSKLDGPDADQLSVIRLAREVSLSPDRLRHVFRAQVGIPIRSYKLWSRLRRAATLLATHDSITEIAHAAGFSDSAHLSRSFRQMFGVVPSELLSDSQITRVD